VFLRQIHVDELVRELVAQLPECAPAKFTAISAPMAEVVEALHGNGKANGQLMQTLAGMSPAMRNLKQLVSSESTGGGELHVAVRDRLGRSRRIPHSLGYTDTAYGPALNLVQQNESGDQWATFAPRQPPSHRHPTPRTPRHTLTALNAPARSPSVTAICAQIAVTDSDGR
jgi:hypothetical protein